MTWKDLKTLIDQLRPDEMEDTICFYYEDCQGKDRVVACDAYIYTGRLEDTESGVAVEPKHWYLAEPFYAGCQRYSPASERK